MRHSMFTVNSVTRGHHVTCFLVVMISLSMLFNSGCAGPKLNFLSGEMDPLQEFTLEGTAREKILVISITGIISDEKQRDLFQTRPSMLQEVVSQLNKAEKDKNVKAVLLKINSPGGTTTASDILYNEILNFKKRTHAKVVASMMNVAASGGYYVALPADYILAHPTTVTGSVGVIMMRLEAFDLMKKIGLDVKTTTSGDKKDMGTPFREMTKEEGAIFQQLSDSLGKRFTGLVAQHRKLDSNALADVATARIYGAEEAVKIGLVDDIGYLNDAITRAKIIGGLPEDAKIVVYRTRKFPDDNLYNTMTSQYSGGNLSLVNIGLFANMPDLHTGFYYLWSPGDFGKE